MFTALDWRILGPPWRVTQWMTGTLKKDIAIDATAAAAVEVEQADQTSRVEVEERKKKEEERVDDAAKEPFRVALDALRRYVTSPDLSLKCAVSVSLDCGDDDDVSFFFDDDDDDVVVARNTRGEEGAQRGGEQKQTEPPETAAAAAATTSLLSIEGREEEKSDESSVPNIAFALSNWEGGTRYHPKRREENDDENNEENTTGRSGRTEDGGGGGGGLEDGTMAEFTITFSIQDLLDDKAAYDVAFSLAIGELSEQSGGTQSRTMSPTM